MLTLRTSHRPDGKIADELASTHDCTTAADASVNYRGCVLQRPCKIPIVPMRFSHVLRFVLAGRWCRCPEWLGDLLIVHHHWQHSFFCACSCSKVSIAPMGKLLTRLPQLSLPQLWLTLRSTTGCTCRRDLEKFPSPDGKIADVLALTHACTTANDASVNYRGCVLKRPRKFPSPRWEKC